MAQKTRKCLLCKRTIDDSWGELKEHLLSRDDIPDDVMEAFRSKKYRITLGGELYFTEIPIPLQYYHRDDVELLNDDDANTRDPAYNYIYFGDIQKHARVPKDKIKHTQLHINLCDVCATVLQQIHLESNRYADDVVRDTCIPSGAKLTAEIVIQQAKEPK